jgi:hypothetical protein
MGFVSACTLSFMSKYLHQSCGPKSMTRVDINDNNQSFNKNWHLMYVMVCPRLYISHAVGVVSMYMKNPGNEHWEEVKWILRYLRGTTTHALCFEGLDISLQGYVDSDVVGDKDSRMRTTRNVFSVGGTSVSCI